MILICVAESNLPDSLDNLVYINVGVYGKLRDLHYFLYANSYRGSKGNTQIDVKMSQTICDTFETLLSCTFGTNCDIKIKTKNQQTCSYRGFIFRFYYIVDSAKFNDFKIKNILRISFS